MQILELTEHEWDDTYSCQPEASETSQHCKHNVGAGKRTGKAEHSCRDVRGQKNAFPAVPEIRVGSVNKEKHEKIREILMHFLKWRNIQSSILNLLQHTHTYNKI